jgi:hypothetical protein
MFSEGHLADRRGSPGGGEEASVRGRCSRKNTRKCSRATRAGTRSKFPTGDLFAWDEKSTYIKRAPYFDDMADPARSFTISRRCARWPCWAIRHHRSHFAGRQHRGRQSRRENI